MLGLCPFHNEKTPSFSVSPAKGIYHCFGCGKGGNLLNFVMEYENMSFTDAVRFVAQKYNIPIEEDESPVESEEHRKKRESLIAACAYAVKWFQQQMDTAQGRAVGKSYFEERGLRSSTIEDFALGYAPDSWDAFLNDARKNAFSEEILLESGLIKQRDEAKDESRRYYDAYRDRVIFPIADLSGRVVGFGARRLKEDNSPKYINSPENEIYKKSRILYGMHLARKSVKEKDFCILTEGYMDVLTLHQAGIENVVASSGTALTEDQVRLIGRFSRNVVVLYDGDNAGVKAALRGVEIILTGGLQASVVVLPDGHDPDSYCQQVGREGFEQYIEKNSKDFILFKAGVLRQEAGADPIRKAEAIRELVADILKIPDKIRATFYYKTTAEALGVEEEILAAEARKQRRQRNNQTAQTKETPQPSEVVKTDDELIRELTESNDLNLHKSLVSLMLRYGDEVVNEEEDRRIVRDFILEELELDGIKLSDPRLQKIVDKALEDPFISTSELIVHLQEDPELGQLLADMLFDKEHLSENWKKYDIIIQKPEDQFRKVIVQNLNLIKMRILEQEIEMNQDRMKGASSEEELQEIMLIQRDLLEKRLRIAGIFGTVIIK